MTSYQPKGDQPRAIAELMEGLGAGERHQVLLGVTGSGKTFTMAKVIEQSNRPALILAHNKTLAAQLYHEFKQFFPNNAVEYFVSYYDYYQPEAYIPAGDLYIEKEATVNEELDKLRLCGYARVSSNGGMRSLLALSVASMVSDHRKPITGCCCCLKRASTSAGRILPGGLSRFLRAQRCGFPAWRIPGARGHDRGLSYL